MRKKCNASGHILPSAAQGRTEGEHGSDSADRKSEWVVSTLGLREIARTAGYDAVEPTVAF